MKKILVFLLVSCLLAGCGSNVKYKTGLGINTTISSSVNENEVTATANTTSVALTVDQNDKITALSIDVAQTKVVTIDGVLIEEKSITDTKKELRDAYNMKSQSSIGKEWFEQVNFFEKWAIGKNISDVINQDTMQRDATHTRVPVDEDLIAGCTIDVGAFLGAIEEAYVNAVEVK